MIITNDRAIALKREMDRHLDTPWTPKLDNELHNEIADEYARQLSSVYFIRAVSTGLIKIGVSRNVERRLKALSATDEMALLATIECAPMSIERLLQRRFRHLRVRGEWFRPEKELLDYIEHVSLCQHAAALAVVVEAMAATLTPTCPQGPAFAASPSQIERPLGGPKWALLEHVA